MDGADRTRRAKARITRSGDFDAVYRRGRSAAGRHLVVYVFQREEGALAGAPRCGMSISKRVGGAVERNRIKRVLKEHFAAIADGLPLGIDLVIIARPGANEYLEEQGGAALGERMRELIERVTGDAVRVAS